MSDLFDQLKSAGPVKKKQQESSKPPKPKPTPPKPTPLNTSSSLSNNHDKKLEKLEKFNADHKPKSKSSLSSSKDNRRDSLPPSLSTSKTATAATPSGGKKSKGHKSRSLSPPKFGVEKVIKSLKVKLERKKLEEFLSRPLDEHANNIRVKHKKTTPTKAQQKLFEPSSSSSMIGNKKSKTQILREFNIKPCKVRIHRDNLPRLLKEFKNKKNAKKDSKSLGGNKRPAATTSNSGAPPAKKGKFSTPSAPKNKSSFFIKLNTSPPSKLEKRLKNLSRSSSAMAHHNKIRNSKTTPTTPTKFSRSQLIRSFGQRFFNVHVKIERCTHPLMLTFESNDRARRLQAKRNNKSKNLSVSFREQVEIFGGSSESDDSYDEDFCAVPNRGNARKSTAQNSKSVPATPVVMPARLKKVENGKVVDDIELDPSLFVDPKSLVASTPFSPGRKKRDHKSFSPLKDEGTPSPRKEQLKLANEKIPPTGLRRLNIEDEDDEDDDCEYIVPIELPHRRTSQHSFDGVASSSVPLAESTAMFTDNNDIEDLTEEPRNLVTPDIDFQAEPTNNIFRPLNEKSNEATRKNDNNQLEVISDDSFQSAPVTQTNKLSALSTLHKSPTLGLNDNALDMAEDEEDTRSDTDHRPQNNGNYIGGVTNTNNVGFNAINKTNNTMEDISMNLFMDDSQSNENDNHSKSFVDSLINETIDKLTKDIDEGARDEHFTDTN